MSLAPKVRQSALADRARERFLLRFRLRSRTARLHLFAFVVKLAPIAEPLVPVTFGIRLLEPSPSAKKRKKASVWPTATETNVQLSLFD